MPGPFQGDIPKCPRSDPGANGSPFKQPLLLNQKLALISSVKSRSVIKFLLCVLC